MAYKDDSKFSVEDFANTDSIDDLVNSHYISDYNVSDANGYTPLCFMALNGCRPDLIVYLVNKKNANASLACDKGSTPLELACMSCNTEAVEALIGKEVISRNKDGDIEYTDEIVENPKKDAAGNPIPKRDENDDIVYVKDKYGTPLPLPLYVEDGEENYTVQYRAYSTYKDESTGKIIVESVCKVPPMTPEHPHIMLKYKKDAAGNHQPMRDEDGNPYKQYDKDTLQPINKIDSNTLKPIKNKFEYVWDYEYLPEYEVGYAAKTCNIDEDHGKANVVAKDILKAASNKDASIFEALTDYYQADEFTYTFDDGVTGNIELKIWDPVMTFNGTTEDGKWNYTTNYFNENKDSPLIVACRMQLNDVVDFILTNIESAIIKYNKDHASRQLQNQKAYIVKALEHHTKDIDGNSESAVSIAASLNDISLINIFKRHIRENVSSDVLEDVLMQATSELPALLIDN